MFYLGNKDLLNKEITAFLCSRVISASVVLRSYDWAKEQRAMGRCVICGNHSQIEKDVFDILLRGKQPLILVLARGFYKQWPPEIRKALDEGRLLIVTSFSEKIKRATQETAQQRNTLMLSVSTDIVVGDITPGGLLDKLLENRLYGIV